MAAEPGGGARPRREDCGSCIGSDTINIYCDESCHLLHDHQQAMVLGAIWCDAAHRAALGRKIKLLRREFGLSPLFEARHIGSPKAKQPE